MKKPTTRQPFFSQLLEKQEARPKEEREGVSNDTKPPAGGDPPPHTLKFPSDSDEGQ